MKRIWLRLCGSRPAFLLAALSIQLAIGDKTFSATVEENDATDALIVLPQKKVGYDYA